jgi:hypothetical protein
MVHLKVSVDAKLLKWLDRSAREAGVSRSTLARVLLQDYSKRLGEFRPANFIVQDKPVKGRYVVEK